MKMIFISTIALWFALTTNAQTIERKVLSSGGKSKTVGSLTLEYTVGETFVKTLSSANNKITQGFHQPIITVARIENPSATFVPVDETNSSENPSAEKSSLVTKSNFKIKVFPNPATDFVNVRMNESRSAKCFVTLLDISGKIISIEEIFQNETRIDFTTLASGKYFISVKSEDSKVNESFRIVKAE